MKKQHIGLYPGTFDPITLGHIDIIQRAARVVDELVIGVAKNTGKGPLFDTKARVKMVENEVAPRGQEAQLLAQPKAEREEDQRGDKDGVGDHGLRLRYAGNEVEK